MIIGPAQVFPFGPTAADVDAVDQASIVHGWALIETSGLLPARVELVDGEHGPLIAPFSLCAGESVRDWLSGAGIYAVTGLYVRVVTGTVEGSLWFRPATAHAVHAPLDVDDMLSQLVDAMFDGRQ